MFPGNMQFPLTSYMYILDLHFCLLACRVLASHRRECIFVTLAFHNPAVVYIVQGGEYLDSHLFNRTGCACRQNTLPHIYTVTLYMRTAIKLLAKNAKGFELALQSVTQSKGFL